MTLLRSGSQRSPAAFLVAVSLGLLLSLARPAGALAIQTTIAYQGGGSAAVSNSSSMSLNAPSTKALGDMLIIQAEASGTGSIAIGNSFITIPGASGVVGGNYVITAYKISTASGATSIPVTLGSNREAVGTLLDYSGVDNVNPIENSFASGTDPITGSGTTFTVPSLTTTDPNSWVVGLALAWPTAASLTSTAPSGAVTRSGAAAAQTTASPYSDLTPFDTPFPTASPTGTATGTFSASTPWELTAIALRPAQVSIASAPSTGSLGAVTLTGAQQISHAQMGNFAVTDTRGTTGATWSLTVQGASGIGLSPKFAQYCPNSSCGTDTGPGYVTGGATLPAGSLTLSTSGASWSGGTGTLPTFGCSSAPCALDGASPATVASDANGLGTWSTSGFSATSLSLSVPANAYAFPNAGELYRVDLLWTLSSGP